MAYDALGRLRLVTGHPGVRMQFTYDKVGNRIHQNSQFNQYDINTQQSSTLTQDYYYAYDTMNRQILVDGAHNHNVNDDSNLTDASGKILTYNQNGSTTTANLTDKPGHRITYDKNGNRTSDTSWGRAVTRVGGELTNSYNYDGSINYDPEGNPILVPGEVYYVGGAGLATQKYTYDAQNRLQTVSEVATDISYGATTSAIDIMVDRRAYDGAGRLTDAGLGANEVIDFLIARNEGAAHVDQLHGAYVRHFDYNANGQLTHESVKDAYLTPKYDVYNTLYNEAGNLLSTHTDQHGEGGFTTTTNNFYKARDSYLQYQATSSRSDNASAPGTATSTYDANNYLIAFDDTKNNADDRTYRNNAQGQILQKTQQSRTVQQIVIDNQVYATVGIGTDPLKPNNDDGSPHYIQQSNLNIAYRPLDANALSSPSRYSVRAGDSLQSIALSFYGDAQLWYQIADANGLTDGNSSLRVGQSLSVPAQLGVHNTNDTFRPYDSSQITGNTSPYLAPPAQDEGCGALAVC